MVAVAPGLFYRHLSVVQVLERVREQATMHIARHNATVIDLGERLSLRTEVLQEFALAQRRTG